MKPIILKIDANGNVTITADEIEKMVRDAYEQGFADGQKNVQIVTQPVPYYEPRSNWWDHVIVTCKTPEVYM